MVCRLMEAVSHTTGDVGRKSLPEIDSAIRSDAPGDIEVFEYPASPEAPSLPLSNSLADTDDQSTSLDAAGEMAKTEQPAEREKLQAEEIRRSFEAGRVQGRQEGSKAEHEAQAAALATNEEQRVRQAAELIESFAVERDKYMARVEHEVVELALAVAARILRREAQMDPLLLTGAVRVALGQLSGSTQVRLRVPARELALWTESIAMLPNLALKPVVLAGEDMQLGDCVIETELGSVDLGIRSQLGEIERGFFDRAGGDQAKSTTVVNNVEPEHHS
jgi:flagellar assembly protein FliH